MLLNNEVFMHEFEKFINDIPGFPQKGVIFKDFSPLLKYKLTDVVKELAELIDWTDVEYVGGIESRGFILGAALAAHKGIGFVPIRKKGKLPPPTISESYALEYGEDTLEIHPSDRRGKIVLLDDVLATGGTMKTAITLCKKASYEVSAILVLINLRFLNSFEEDGIEVKSILNYD
jgi:adenine phosphoribosyltransferase